MQLVLDWLKSNTMLCMISDAFLYLIATESSKKERTNGMRQRCKKGVHHKKRSGMPHRIAGDAQVRAFRYTGGASILQVFFSVGLWLLSSLSCRRLYLSSRMSSRKLTGPAYVLVCVVLCVSTFLLVNFIGSSLGNLFSEDIGPYIGSKAIHGWKFGVLSLLGTVGLEFNRNPFLTSVVLVVLLWGPMFWLWSKAVALISRSMSSDEEESQEGNSAQCEVSPDDNRL